LWEQANVAISQTTTEKPGGTGLAGFGRTSLFPQLEDLGQCGKPWLYKSKTRKYKQHNKQ
jgi:hypothetical protein